MELYLLYRQLLQMLVYKFVNAAEDGTNTLTISPNANDGIQYAGSATDNKDLINTKATSKQGDYVVIDIFRQHN